MGNLYFDQQRFFFSSVLKKIKVALLKSVLESLAEFAMYVDKMVPKYSHLLNDTVCNIQLGKKHLLNSGGQELLGEHTHSVQIVV